MNQDEKQVEEFDKLHGGDDGSVVVGGRVLFSDGARRSLKAFAGVGFEFAATPTDPKDLLHLQKTFWELKLEELVTQFEDLRNRCKTLAKTDGARFHERLAELKGLETKVRSARTKLSRIVTQERGFTQADVDRAWETWNEFSASCAAESHAKQKYESGLLGKSSAGVMEKLKAAYDQAKRHSERAMNAWNDLTPSEARAIVSEELDAERRRQRESELEQIEV